MAQTNQHFSIIPALQIVAWTGFGSGMPDGRPTVNLSLFGILCRRLFCKYSISRDISTGLQFLLHSRHLQCTAISSRNECEPHGTENRTSRHSSIRTATTDGVEDSVLACPVRHVYLSFTESKCTILKPISKRRIAIQRSIRSLSRHVKRDVFLRHRSKRLCGIELNSTQS